MTNEPDLRAAFRSGDSDVVRRLAADQVEHARRAGDTSAEVEGLYALARVALRDHDLKEAEDTAHEALAIARGSGHRALEERPLHVLAAIARVSGDDARAAALYEASLELNAELGNNVNVHTESHNLAMTELHLGNTERARLLIADSQERVRRGGLDDFVPYLGIAGAMLALADGDPRRAAQMIGLTDQAFALLGHVPDPDDATELTTMRHRLAVTLEADTMQNELAAGASLSLAEAFGGTWPK